MSTGSPAGAPSAASATRNLPDTRTFRLTGVPPTARAGTEGRRPARDALPASVCGEAAHTVELLLTELVTNAVLHARTMLEVTITGWHDRLRCEVTDADPRVPEVAPRRPRAGLGLLLVDELATGWGVRPARQGKTVWFDVRIVR